MANDTKEHWDGARIVWTVSYVHDGPKTKDISAEALQPHEEHRKKLVAKLEIQKDDIQSVLPISKVRLVRDLTRLDDAHQFVALFSSSTELGTNEHSRSHRPTSVASHESVHCHSGWKGCGRDTSKLLPCRRRKCH